jgi:hypothetical protein
VVPLGGRTALQKPFSAAADAVSIVTRRLNYYKDILLVYAIALLSQELIFHSVV